MGHGHGHGHAHAHLHIDEKTGDRRVAMAIVVNLGLTIVQIVGGLISGSIALVADAVHNLSDALSLVIAFAARRIARTPSSPSMTFGYARAEIIAALINYTSLILIGMYLVYEAFLRFWSPSEIAGWVVVVIAGVALAIDAVTALLTYSLARESINIRAAFLHNVADALGSVGVIVAGTLIILYDWYWVDPLVTLAIAAYILQQSFVHIGPVIRILMLGTPLNLDVEEVIDSLTGIPGIIGVHHVHLWQLNEHRVFLEAHLVIDEEVLDDPHAVVHEASRLVGRKFDIEHTTFQVEPVHRDCTDRPKNIHCA